MSQYLATIRGITFWSTTINALSLRHPLVLVGGLLALIGLILPVRPAHAQASGPRPLAVSFTNVLVSHDTFKAHSEPAIAENPANAKNLVAGSKFFTDPLHYQFKIGTFYSTNGGQTWHDDGLLPGYDNYTITSDISFAYSPNGSLVYACLLATDGTDSGVFVSRSRDGGKTWLDPSTVFLDTTGATFSDKPWIAVDWSHSPARGSVYVAWNLDSNSDANGQDPDVHLSPQQVTDTLTPGLVVARSTDYGKTFSAPAMVSPFDDHNFALGAQPAVGPDGRVYVAFLGFHDSATKTINDMELSSSSDQGATFSPPKVVAGDIAPLPNHLPTSTFRNLSLPTFAVSPADGSLLLAWADERYGDSDILAIRSKDRGSAWSAPTRVNHDSKHDGKDQFQPVLAVAANGTYTCAWFDRRLDPKNHLIDVFVAQSTNDGVNFGHNVRVTRKSWDPGVDAPLPEGKPNNTFIGDYQALAVDDLTVHPLWNDTQNGTSQEIRTAVVSVQVFARRH
jgi:hypothetical protein